MGHQKLTKAVQLIVVEAILCHVHMAVAIDQVSLAVFTALSVRAVNAGGGAADVVVHGASIVMGVL